MNFNKIAKQTDSQTVQGRITTNRVTNWWWDRISRLDNQSIYTTRFLLERFRNTTVNIMEDPTSEWIRVKIVPHLSKIQFSLLVKSSRILGGWYANKWLRLTGPRSGTRGRQRETTSVDSHDIMTSQIMRNLLRAKYLIIIIIILVWWIRVPGLIIEYWYKRWFMVRACPCTVCLVMCESIRRLVHSGLIIWVGKLTKQQPQHILWLDTVNKLQTVRVSCHSTYNKILEQSTSEKSNLSFSNRERQTFV